MIVDGRIPNYFEIAGMCFSIIGAVTMSIPKKQTQTVKQWSIFSSKLTWFEYQSENT